MSIRLKFEKYWGELSMINIFLYVAIAPDPQYKIEGIVYGLEITNKKTDHIAARVKETFSRLYDEFVVLRDVNIPTPTPTALPPPEVRMVKKHK